MICGANVTMRSVVAPEHGRAGAGRVRVGRDEQVGDRPGEGDDGHRDRQQDQHRPGQQRRGDLGDVRLLDLVGVGPARRPGQHRDHRAGERAAQGELVDQVRDGVGGDVGGAEAARAHALREDDRADEAEQSRQGGEDGDEQRAAGDQRCPRRAPRGPSECALVRLALSVCTPLPQPSARRHGLTRLRLRPSGAGWQAHDIVWPEPSCRPQPRDLPGRVRIELAPARAGELGGQVLPHRHGLVPGRVGRAHAARQALDQRVDVAVVKVGRGPSRDEHAVDPRGGDAVHGGDPLLVRPAGDGVAEVDEQGAAGRA